MAVVTRARRSSVTQDMPQRRRRIRITITKFTGITSTAMIARSGWMIAMSTNTANSESPTITTVGTIRMTSSMRSRSVMARVTIWPVARPSSREGSVDCRRSYSHTRSSNSRW
jgi:hypothetical protein